ncbi:MAG: hypothetical protein FJX61_10705 [Alphaproteobacteria bacterium]|nr:hypothetical protein [Alphaproteobacteria bacterium]
MSDMRAVATLLGRLGALAVIIMGLGAGSSFAQTPDIPINAFFGRWAGSGVSQTGESIAFQYTHRDLNVNVNPVGNGFSVTWTTVQRQTGDPTKPQESRKLTTLTFVAIGRPNVWRATGSLDPMGINGYSWAKLRGQTLTINTFAVQPGGSYEILTYDRTLSGLGMQLEFSRLVDGDVKRTVRGQLTKFTD